MMIIFGFTLTAHGKIVVLLLVSVLGLSGYGGIPPRFRPPRTYNSNAGLTSYGAGVHLTTSS
jgi:hypothetical protein